PTATDPDHTLTHQGNCNAVTPLPQAALLFYRAHYLAGNIAAIDALCEALHDRHLQPVPIFVSSLRDPDVQADLLTYLKPKDESGAQILLNTTSFSLARLEAESPNVALWQQIDVPVLQVILSGGTTAAWQTQLRGLSPRDVAMNVALPEVDGRIISRAVSFKAVQTRHPQLETDVVTYQPEPDRVQFVAELAANWVKLRQTPIAEQRIALILANYPTRDGRLANGVGLDTPASCVEILQALQQAGYPVADLPDNSDRLIQQLTSGFTNDREGSRSIQQTLAAADYAKFFASLSEAVQQGVIDRWGEFDGADLPIAGIQYGSVFVGIQPARGYDLDPSLSYHVPDLAPTHAYLAFYAWVRQQFGAQAIVHVGKHGNLEWLPGKSVALSQDCYPEAALGAMPHLYPFIVNDPGEGSQAKRRSQAVILDHLTPPMTRAELYGNLQQLENLVDEYYEAETLDPTRLSLIRDRIFGLLEQEHLQQEIGWSAQGLMPTSGDETGVFNSLDRYLCELKEAQIRDGLHIFGQCPQGVQLRDLILSIARNPGAGRLGLTRAIAQDWQLGFDPLTADLGSACKMNLASTRSTNLDTSLATKFEKYQKRILEHQGESNLLNENLLDEDLLDAIHQTILDRFSHCRTLGDAVEQLEQIAAQWVEAIMMNQPIVEVLPGLAAQAELGWIADRLLPALRQTDREMTNLLHGLRGGYIPSGASGAPTRGRPEVLPTGRNFYSVDIRAIPTESAWAVGRKAAETLIEQYTQEQGEYPQRLALSVWGTATMRTGGDDLAEALALLGVQPVWDGAARRVIDFEILPLSVLGRPRVDVTLRISGFFRDAFPNLIDLFQQAVDAVAELDEPAEWNPIAAQVQQDCQTGQESGLDADRALQQARYRVFGAKPGAYGAGLQGLIESQAWTDDSDLAQAYLNWSSYAYTGTQAGVAAPEVFTQRIRQLQIVLQNQDNREHDLLDSDDYYQFQGGLTAAVRALTGANPITYFGDHSLPEQPKIRTLTQEIARVYRSRVVNPKWIAGAMRHGYKGAFEMAATVDFLFAYDATARCVEDYMYEGVAQAYILDETVQAWIQEKNPNALRDMAERLLEANQRGLWQQVNLKLIDQLRSIALQAEAVIESRSHSG
ncbi:MAG: cobaltochelatase subunit CobN, partial [Elainella sp. Prado103]|nr:cobaltochelatase subunit CobN [Elainella sp. Prado103]